MQGRRGQNGEPEDSHSSQRLAALNGNGKHHRPLPYRPPDMTRVDQLPPTPRVGRPVRRSPAPRRMRRTLLILGGVVVVCALFACTFGYIASNYFSGIGASSGAATTATDFLSALASRSYSEAYKDLGAPITIQMTSTQFTQQAERDDTCYGVVTNYAEVANSAVVQGNSQSYSYTITRSKLARPYQLRLTLQQDQEAPGTWQVTSYGDDLGPQPPTCK